METIVLATDFSANANRVAHFAAQLAREQQAELILLHAYQFWPHNPAKTGDFPLSRDSVRKRSKQCLVQLASELTEIIDSTLSLRCMVEEGSPMSVLRRIPRQERADLLIMSTVGTAPQSAQLMGSVASEMVAQTEVPLLLVPPGITYAGLKNVVLGIDLELPPNAIVFESVLHLTRLFGSVINVLCISDKASDADRQHQAEHIRHLLNPQPHTLTIEAGDQIYDTLLAFAHTNKADLIIMLPQMRNWICQLVTEGETQRMARLSDIPLLAVV